MKSPISRTNAAYAAVVIGGSAGSAMIFTDILSALPRSFPIPVFVVQHLHETDDGYFAEHLKRDSRLTVVIPFDKQPIEKGCVYVAPANYHMLLERNETVSLSVDKKVNWSRPSIDVLFESAAYACGSNLIAVILSGASADGAKGMRTVKDCGGVTIAQLPESAEFPLMPQAAIDEARPLYVILPAEMPGLIVDLGAGSAAGRLSNACSAKDLDSR